MVRRFLFLLFVAGASGTLGVWVGFLFAPAPGAETRASLAAFFDEHDETIADFYTRGLAAVGDAADVVSSTVDAQVDDDNDEDEEDHDDDG